MTIRTATVRDLEEVASWITSARECRRWAGSRVPFPIDLESLPDTIAFVEAGTVAVFDGDLLAAFGQLVGKPANRGHLARLIVNPARRRQGFGGILVRTLVEKARRESFERISLNVDRANEAAVSLYQKVGFRDARRPPDELAYRGSRYMEYDAHAD